MRGVSAPSRSSAASLAGVVTTSWAAVAAAPRAGASPAIAVAARSAPHSAATAAASSLT